MKIMFDPRNPQDVAEVQAFLARAPGAAMSGVGQAGPAMAAPAASMMPGLTQPSMITQAPGPTLDDLKVQMVGAIEKSGGDPMRVLTHLVNTVPGFKNLPETTPDMYPAVSAALAAFG